LQAQLELASHYPYQKLVLLSLSIRSILGLSPCCNLI
jgi:hypothetical protein